MERRVWESGRIIRRHHGIDELSGRSNILRSASLWIWCSDSDSSGEGLFRSLDFEYNYGIIYDLSVWIYKKNDYENRKEIYYRDEIPLRQDGELKLLSTGEDVRDIVINDTYDMDIEIRFKNVGSQSVDCRFELNYAAYIE